MKHVPFEEAGLLQINYDGPTLDLLAFGTLQLELQAIIDRVALALLAMEGLIEIPRAWLLFQKPHPSIPARPSGRMGLEELMPLRVLAQRVRSESPLEQDLAFALAAVFADPNARSVLQGVAANVITAIAATGLRGIRSFVERRRPQVLHNVDVGPHLRSLAMALARNANGQKASLRVSHSRGQERFEVHLDIEPDGE